MHVWDSFDSGPLIVQTQNLHHTLFAGDGEIGSSEWSAIFSRVESQIQSLQRRRIHRDQNDERNLGTGVQPLQSVQFQLHRWWTFEVLWPWLHHVHAVCEPGWCESRSTFCQDVNKGRWRSDKLKCERTQREFLTLPNEQRTKQLDVLLTGAASNEGDWKAARTEPSRHHLRAERRRRWRRDGRAAHRTRHRAEHEQAPHAQGAPHAGARLPCQGGVFRFAHPLQKAVTPLTASKHHL